MSRLRLCSISLETRTSLYTVFAFIMPRQNAYRSSGGSGNISGSQNPSSRTAAGSNYYRSTVPTSYSGNETAAKALVEMFVVGAEIDEVDLNSVQTHRPDARGHYDVTWKMKDGSAMSGRVTNSFN